MNLKNTKRRIMALCMSGLLLCLCGCSAGGDTESSSTADKEKSAAVSAESAEKSDESAESKDDDVGSRLVMKTFGELWLGTAYYIDVNMKVEYSADALAGSDSSADKTGKTEKQYDFIIAVDAPGDRAGLNMISDSGNLCCVVKDGNIYTIDHSNQTYISEPYSEDVVKFGEQYTTGICLGTINQLEFQNTGKTDYSGQQVVFENYKLKPSDTSGTGNQLGDTYITYYFDENDRPVAEVMQTSAGLTTFTFNKVSGKIEVEDILEIPEGYKKA